MNRSDVVRAISAKSDLTQDGVSSTLDALGEVLREAASRSEKVQITGLFAMEVVERAARTGRNPRTGEIMNIPATPSVRMTPGTPLKAAARGAK